MDTKVMGRNDVAAAKLYDGRHDGARRDKLGKEVLHRADGSASDHDRAALEQRLKVNAWIQVQILDGCGSRPISAKR
jgi:hypothetical protein